MKKLNVAIGDFGRKMYSFYAYVRNYKNHQVEEEIRDLEIAELNERIKYYKKQINDLTNDKIGYDDILKIKDSKITDLKEKLSNTIREFNSKFDDLSIQLETKDTLLVKESKKVIDLEKKLKEKESKRIASVGTINSKQKKIDNLEKEIIKLKELHKTELAKKNETIAFLKTHRRAPSEEEIKAYDYQFKEVEKRIRNEKK